MTRRDCREGCDFGPITTTAAISPRKGRISLNRILDRMSGIAICEAAHGSPDARRYTYEATWQMRGLTELNLEFNPIRRARPRHSGALDRDACRMAYSCRVSRTCSSEYWSHPEACLGDGY